MTTPTIITMARAHARGQLLLLNISSQTTRPIIRFSAPPSSEGMTNSPKQGMNTNMEPATTPERLKGTVTNQKVCHGVAPKSWDASSKRVSSLTKLAYKGSTMKGR